MKRSRKILYVSLSILGVLFFILPLITYGILSKAVLPPEKLTPLIIEKTNQFLEAHLECERIELTYFQTWPHLGIQLINGRLISHVAEDSTVHEDELIIPSDSLLSFSKVTVSLRPTDYIFGGKITIGEISIERPRFYGYVNKNGRANWDIYQSETDTTQSDTSSKRIPPIDLQKVHISDGHFTYDDHQQNLYTDIKGFFLHLKGSFDKGKNILDIETGISSILFESPVYTLSNKLDMTLKSQLLLSNHYNTILLKEAELKMNKLPFTADGSIDLLSSGRTKIDMRVGFNVSDMNDLLKFIPDSYFQNRDKVLAQGKIVMEGNILGELGDSIVPTVNLCCKIQDGSYHIKNIPQGIDSLKMDLDLHMNGIYPDSSYLSLEELTIKGMNTSLNMQGKVFNILKNPTIKTNITGKIDFTRLAKEFINPDTLLVQGVMDADLSASFNMNDILNNRYDRVQASGNLNIDSFKVYSQPLDLDMYISGSHMSIGSIKKESRYLDNDKFLNATLTLDSINIDYKDEIRTNISNLELQANTPPTFDTSAVIPLTTRLQFDYLKTRLPDSAWVVAGKTKLLGGIKSSVTNKKRPQAGATISVDTLRYFIAPKRTGFILTGSRFNVEALPYRDARRQRMQDSVRSSRIRKRAAYTQIAKDSTESSSPSLLQKWEVRGNILFKQMRAFSRFFPLPIFMKETDMKFNTNTITLKDAEVHLGKSTLVLSGEINKIRRALLRGGKLNGEFLLSSDYIDCNELMQAVTSGFIFSEQLGSSSTLSIEKENQMATELNVQTIQDIIPLAPIDTTDQLFVLPDYLDMTLHTQAKLIDFKELKLENVEGEVTLKNQSVNLNNLSMHSNMGDGDLTMIYTAKNKNEATAGLDLNLENIQVEGLIGLFPSIDSLVPMLRSFEGVVDCQLTATCKLDSSMSVMLPSLNSACYLHGKDMVLLDGETFTEISKTLMFKNKKRNMIDSISVDLAIKDNKIEVFPFIVEMDRYKVAVGGTHNLDMTFNYHLSVLKSPVPFKLGIDITGNIDKFKYKIVKCKYKDLFKPAKQAELDSTRIHIRQEIRESIRKQLKESLLEHIQKN